jgi:hypothetical protein
MSRERVARPGCCPRQFSKGDAPIVHGPVTWMGERCETCLTILQGGFLSRRNKDVWREEYVYHLALVHKSGEIPVVLAST